MFFGFSKFERNRNVLWHLNIMSPRTLVINSSFKAASALLNFANFELAATAFYVSIKLCITVLLIFSLYCACMSFFVSVAHVT